MTMGAIDVKREETEREKDNIEVMLKMIYIPHISFCSFSFGSRTLNVAVLSSALCARSTNSGTSSVNVPRQHTTRFRQFRSQSQPPIHPSIHPKCLR
jgi:hypothetical protein